MTESRARLAEITLPDFGMPATEPLLPPSIFADRLDRLRSAMDTHRYDHLVVWADREHSANIAYLTGFDPRFEEAVLIVGATGDPAILLGNECFDLGAAAPLPVRPVRFQDLSLPGQARDNSRPLAETLRDEGIGPGSRVGVVGWKTYANRANDRGAGIPRRRAPVGRWRERARGERHRPAHQRDRWTPCDQRGRATRGVRMGGVPDLAQRAQRADRAATRHDRAGGRSIARMERCTAVVPSHAQRRAAGAVRAVESR